MINLFILISMGVGLKVRDIHALMHGHTYAIKKTIN